MVIVELNLVVAFAFSDYAVVVGLVENGGEIPCLFVSVTNSENKNNRKWLIVMISMVAFSSR